MNYLKIETAPDFRHTDAARPGSWYAVQIETFQGKSILGYVARSKEKGEGWLAWGVNGRFWSSYSATRKGAASALFAAENFL